jgi:hypothetical protein
MSSNPQERDVARHMGFGRPRPKLPLPVHASAEGSASPFLEKLGARAGGRVAFIGVTDPSLVALRTGMGSRITAGVPREQVDAIVYQIDSSFALRRLREFSSLVKLTGCLWVVWPRNHGQIDAAHVQRSGIAAGLVDIQALNVAPRLVGLKFIHPRRTW